MSQADSWSAAWGVVVNQNRGPEEGQPSITREPHQGRCEDSGRWARIALTGAWPGGGARGVTLPCFHVVCLPASAHIASEPRLSVPLNEFSRHLGVTFHIVRVVPSNSTDGYSFIPVGRDVPSRSTRLGSSPSTRTLSHPPGVLVPCSTQQRSSRARLGAPAHPPLHK